MEIAQEHRQNEDQYADFQRQFRIDDHTLAQCHIAALNAWDRIEESGKRLINEIIQ